MDDFLGSGIGQPDAHVPEKVLTAGTQVCMQKNNRSTAQNPQIFRISANLANILRSA
ncbi:MAG: hypothetical protein ABIL58_01485 [Pseudomonadota bacterium]